MDEYDVPLAKANEGKYYNDMLEIIRSLFDRAFKTNEYLKFGVITGCMKIKEAPPSLGSKIPRQVNGVGVPAKLENTSLSSYSQYFGFTEKDVHCLLEAAGLTEHSDTFKEWYDGYRFGQVDVYCPWDVLNYASALQKDSQAEPEPYWVNSSGNYILRSFLRKATRTTKMEIEELISGGTVVKDISEQLTYNELEKNIANLWSVLYMTGYLTTRSKVGRGRYELVIPNREVNEIFISQIQNWFEEDVVEKEPAALDALCSAFLTGDTSEIEARMDGFLGKSISLRDTFISKPKKENFYHGLLLGMLMSREDWYVHSNSEDGEGYSDIHVEAEDADTAFVIEVKYGEKDDLEKACREAMEQIDRMHYTENLVDLGFGTIYAYGIACFKKHCRVERRIVRQARK